MPVSREAQQAYLDGYASLQAAKSRFQLEMLDTAEHNLRHAIELNPGYPDALAALADAEMLSLFIKDEPNAGRIGQRGTTRSGSPGKKPPAFRSTRGAVWYCDRSRPR